MARYFNVTAAFEKSVQPNISLNDNIMIIK